MISKIFVLAVVLCASLAQVRGESVEYDIKRALFRLQDRSKAAEEKVNYVFKNINAKLDLLETKTRIFLEKESRMEERIKENVQRTAEIMEQKATEENKPNATFVCIARAEKQTVSKIEEFGPKFEVDVRRIERTKINVIEVAKKPLITIEDSLEERYEKAAGEIRSCKNSASVRKVLARAMRDYDLLFSEVRRIEERVGIAFSQFMRDCSNLFKNYSRQMERIQAEGLGAIRRCMYAKDIFGQN